MKNFKLYLLFLLLFVIVFILGCEQTQSQPVVPPLNDVQTLQIQEVSTLTTSSPSSDAPLPNSSLSGRVLIQERIGHFSVVNMNDYNYSQPLIALPIWSPDNEIADFLLRDPHWSNGGEKIAFVCTPPLSIDEANPENFYHLSICILDSKYLGDENASSHIQKITIYYGDAFHVIDPKFQGFTLEIQNIAWSPDDQFLIVTVVFKAGKYEVPFFSVNPCLIELPSGNSQCGETNSLLAEFSKEERAFISAGYAISWATENVDIFAFPTWKIWMPEGLDPNIEVSDEIAPKLRLDNGLHVLDTKAKTFNTIWIVDKYAINFNQPPLWSYGKDQLSFIVYGNHDEYGFLIDTVMSIDKNGENPIQLFNSYDLYAQIPSILPTEVLQESFQDIHISDIHLISWSSDDRFLMFSFSLSNYTKNIFLYDTKSGYFYPVTNWKTPAENPQNTSYPTWER